MIQLYCRSQTKKSDSGSYCC